MESGEISSVPRLNCHVCGQDHQLVPLKRGQRALCSRCGTLLVKRNRFGPAAPLAFAISGAILAVPAASLPLLTVAKWGNERTTFVLTGFTALWGDGLHILAASVLLTGIVLPLILLGTLVATVLAARSDLWPRSREALKTATATLQHWAMPEVYVLAVLVAFFKMGNSIEVTVGPGLWCYTAMSILMLLAWRSFDHAEEYVGTRMGEADLPSRREATA